MSQQPALSVRPKRIVDARRRRRAWPPSFCEARAGVWGGKSHRIPGFAPPKARGPSVAVAGRDASLRHRFERQRTSIRAPTSARLGPAQPLDERERERHRGAGAATRDERAVGDDGVLDVLDSELRLEAGIRRDAPTGEDSGLRERDRSRTDRGERSAAFVLTADERLDTGVVAQVVAPGRPPGKTTISQRASSATSAISMSALTRDVVRALRCARAHADSCIRRRRAAGRR